MEDGKINIEYEKQEYLFRIIYLIRINLPSSEYVYLFMFLLKSIGYLLISISLNDLSYKNNENDEINNNKNTKFNDFIYNFLSSLLINGNNLNILNKNYQELCIAGFLILFIYILITYFGFIYMKKKYFNNTKITSTEKKMKKITKNSKFEKKLFKIISYFFFLISFFHQYIIEYYIFGFIGYLLYLLGILDSKNFDTNKDAYTIPIKEHIKNLYFHPIFILVINLTTIILILIIFIQFMIINSTKTLFINNGFPIYSNKMFLIIKIIIYNFNPLYGLVNSLSNDIRSKIIIPIMIILIILFLIEIALSYYKFCFYPNISNYLCFFFEIFSLFSNITELIIYLTESEINSLKFFLIKLSFEFVNSFIFIILFIQNKNANNLKQFSVNLFNKKNKNLNLDDIYFYIRIYLKYSKNKENNYIIIFRLIQYHTFFCEKKECPCKKLVPKDISYSKLTNFNIIEREESLNVIEENFSNKNINANKILANQNIYKKFNSNFMNADNQSLSKKKESARNLMLYMAEEENIDLNMRKRSYSVKRNIQHSRLKANFIINDIKEKNKSNIINESNIKINNNTICSNSINKKELNDPNIQKRIKLTDEELKMIGEQEIIDRINFLYEIKNYEILEDYIFIHLQYLIIIKFNYRLALYFVSKYSNFGIKLGFFTRYFLYEIKRYICKSIINSKNLSTIGDSYIIKYNKDNCSMKKLIKFLTFYHIIKKLMKISCQNIIFFCAFRTDLHNSLMLQKYLKTKIYPVIESAEEIQLSINKLKFLIEKHYIEVKIPIQSIELSYLISNFFKLIEGKISQDILKYITPIINFRELYYEKLVNEFHLFMMSNPLIISLTIKDTFNISYFTNYFLEKLGYSYIELKNQDFHEKLFPGSQQLIKEHSFMMKQFLFFYVNLHSKDNTFIKSKEGYLVSINFTCKTFPNFQHNFNLISNIIFNDDILPEFYNNISYKKTNNFNTSNDKVNIYSFLLDYDFDFFGLTKNFYIEYDLNQNMFRELRINFCQFFCIDENKLIEKIFKEKKDLIKKYPIYNQKISLRESNKAYSIFQNIKMENLFKIRDEKFLESYFYSPIYIYEKIDKKRLIRKIPEILNIIDEIGLDYDWYERLLNFKDRIIINSKIENFKDSEINIFGHHHKYKIEENNPSTIIEKINLESNFINFPEQFFGVVFSIKKLGSISYYIVNLHEKINDNIETIKVMHEDGEIKDNKILEKKTFNKKFIKLSSKKNIRINSLLSSSTKTLKGNKDIELGSIKRNTRTKVFFQTPPVNNLRLSNKNLTKEKTFVKTNLKEFPKKFENNTNHSINNNEDSNTFSKKTSIHFDNIELNKINIPKRKEPLDEEEIEPLITKDKFKEILKIYKKRNKILIYLLFIIIHICIIIIIIKFIICKIGFSLSVTVLKIIIYLEMIKVDIYEQAILSIVYCINDNNNNWTQLSFIHSEAKSKSKMIIEHLKILQDNINIILSNKFCKEIANILKFKFPVYTLNLDWTISSGNTDFLKEIRKLTYIAYALSYSTEICQINTFYNYVELGPTKIKTKEINEANNMQKLLFYFLNNILSRYRISFDKLSEECVVSIEKIFFNYQNIILYFLIILIILLLVFIILYIIKVFWDFSYYQLLFRYYYNFENNQLKFENQIYYLYRTILVFTYKNINYFEKVKNNSYLINYNALRNNSINDLKSVHSQMISPKKNKKGNNQENEESKIPESNIINLNGSMNGSSVQFLNNSNNRKLSIINKLEKNNTIINPNIIEKDAKELSQEEPVEFLLKVSKKIIPMPSKISLAFISIGIILYFSFAIANFEETNYKKLNWKYSINLSMNILERIPKLMEILIYSCITVITNNQDAIKGSPTNDNQPKYVKYFKVNSLYYSEDLMNKYFKNNFFGELLRDNYRINYNYNSYLFLEKDNIFINTKHWEKLLNIDGYFCIYATIGERLNSYEGNDIYDFIKEIEYNALNCKIENTEINEWGVKSEINYILQELTNRYIEFITYNNSNMNLTEARTKFFNSSDVKKIFNDMKDPIIIYYNTIINAVYLDFQIKINKLINVQIFYDNCLFLFMILITICFTFVIIKVEKYKKLFVYFSEIPRTLGYD